MSEEGNGLMRAAIAEALIKFEKEHMGRGPNDARVYLVDNLVIVRLQGVLTQAELKLVGSSEPAKGRDLIKRVRRELIEMGRPLLEEVIEGITGSKVESIHTDISTVTGERIVMFTLLGRPGKG
ncbi:DUF2294 domain-containing protein [bacterium]|nr:DUF2294 domain-containing protein [bacterium]